MLLGCAFYESLDCILGEFDLIPEHMFQADDRQTSDPPRAEHPCRSMRNSTWKPTVKLKEAHLMKCLIFLLKLWNIVPSSKPRNPLSLSCAE